MDERKKSIEELEKARQEARSSLDILLENFGENLYARTCSAASGALYDSKADFEDLIQYNIFLGDIAESNVAIEKVEEKNRRFKELEESIEIRENEEKERLKELAAIHRKLGKALLENSAYNDFTSLFKEQADALTTKLESLENRIKDLENKEGSNVFSWIGKSAQGLVLRSFLSKAQESQEQLYLNVGERFTNRNAVSDEDAVAKHREEIDKIRSVSRSAMDELSVLKDEKRMILAGYGIDGNPQKQIQNLKTHIDMVRKELRNLYKNFGAQAAGIMDAEIQPERKYFIDTIVTAEDGEIIGRAARLNQSLFDYEKSINKLRASLSIDEENTKIEKCQKSIFDKKNKISELEDSISDLEENVREAQARILELRKQL